MFRIEDYTFFLKAQCQRTIPKTTRGCFIWRCQQAGDINRTALACWNYVGGRVGVRFDFHGISGELGIIAKENDRGCWRGMRWQGMAEGRGIEGEDRRQATQGIYQANFTIPDTMVPRRHWPCLTATHPYRSLHRLGICICIGEHIVLDGNSHAASLSVVSVART